MLDKAGQSTDGEEETNQTETAYTSVLRYISSKSNASNVAKNKDKSFYGQPKDLVRYFLIPRISIDTTASNAMASEKTATDIF